MASKNLTTEQRFWAKVDKRGPDECWLWTATCIPSGHGHFWGEGKLVYAHRFSWELVNGPVPDGLCILHSCDVPPCVNPSHLWPGTKLDNARDRDRKGRRRINGPGKIIRGEEHPHATLTAALVAEIRSLAGVETQQSIADRLGLSRGTVSKVQLRTRWAHV